MSILCTDEAEEIIRSHGDLVYRFALSLTRHKDIAEDVYQEVFLRYVKKQPHFEDDEHARAWFYVVTRNCCRNHFMSAFIRHSAPLIDEIPVLAEKEYGLYEKVLKLPMKYRNVIHLYYYEGYNTKQIADIIHCKDATVRTRLKRARALLKNMMESEYDENL